MLLKESCKTCGKSIKSIQTQIPHGGFITFVWNCGHIEIKAKNSIVTEYSDKDKFIDKWTAGSEKVFDYTPPEPTHKELYDDLDRWVSDGGQVKKSSIELDEEYNSAKKRMKYANPIWKSLDETKETYEFQKEGTEFIESAQLLGLIADATGVGKTIQALMCIKRNKAIITPTLIVTRSAILYQFAAEYHTWVNKGFASCMVINQRHNIFPGFETYIISKDFLARAGVLDLVKKLGIKCIIIDECQDFKDREAKRTKALIELITECKIKYRIALSGTPIKNRLSEYFTILNLLDPVNFNSPSDFRKKYIGYDGGLNHYEADNFKSITGRYIIRREKADVLKNLPPINQDYQLIEIEDEDIKKSYNHTLGLFESFKNNPVEEITSTQILGWLAKLRAITGMAKVQYTVDWVSEFIESSEDAIAVGIHHEPVREMLFTVFKNKGYSPLSLSGRDSAWEKDKIARLFNSGKNRILVVNTLAGGVGLNLQGCSNAIVVERQWNPADETQFEGRFHRDGQKKNVFITYPIAKGTIDEFFHDMIFCKQNVLAGVGIGKVSDNVNSLQSLKEFGEFVASNRI